MIRYFLLLFLLPQSCLEHSGTNDIEGTYVAHFEHTYAVNDDTLLVTKSSGGKNVFALTRQTGTTRKQEGKTFPKKHTTEKMMGTYNQDSQTITEMKKGRVFIWNDDQQQLQWGNIIYKKVAHL